MGDTYSLQMAALSYLECRVVRVFSAAGAVFRQEFLVSCVFDFVSKLNDKIKGRILYSPQCRWFNWTNYVQHTA